MYIYYTQLIDISNLECYFTLAKNDLFVTIGLGKEKYQTSPKEKAIDTELTEWHEVCEL